MITVLQPALIRPSLAQALQALAADDGDYATERNGVGFNQADAELGHKLAKLPEEWMSPRQRYFAWLMLKKYRMQLRRLGIDYEGIAAPPEPNDELQAIWQAEKAARLEARRIGRQVRLIGTTVLAFAFDYDPIIVAELKIALPVSWHKPTKTWRMHIALQAVAALRRFCALYDFTIGEDAAAAIARVEGEQSRRIEASRAASADFHVEGLLRSLYPFQAAGVAYAVESQRCIIADEMGLGKTIQGIATVHHVEAYPVLCVVPASVKINWAREWAKTVEGKRAVVIDGKKQDRAKLYNQYGEPIADVVIVNYDLLHAWKGALTEYGFGAMIVDEAHYLKSPKSQRTMAATEIATGKQQKRDAEGKAIRGRYLTVSDGVPVRLALTGTPVLSRAAELVAVLRWLGRLDEMGGYWAIVNCSNLEALNARLRASCYVRREKRAVLPELPPIQRTRVTLPIDNRAEYVKAEKSVIAYVYEQAAKDATFLASIAHLSADEQARATRQHQWSKAAAAERAEALARINALKTITARGKLAGIKSWVEDFVESGEPLILFADHIEVQKVLVEAFPGCASVLGEMGSELRMANVDRFQNDPECKLIVCSLGAAREGLTMTKASNVAFVELGWTPGAHDQAEARCYGRMSDLHGANAWYLIGEGTIDEDIEELIAEKRAVVDALTTGESKADASGASVAGDVMKRMIARKG